MELALLPVQETVGRPQFSMDPTHNHRTSQAWAPIVSFNPIGREVELIP